METAERRIKEILKDFDLNSYVESCKGMSIDKFNEYTVSRSKEFDSVILSFKSKDNEGLEKYSDELSKIRVLFDKDLNYVARKDAGLPLKEWEHKLLDELNDSIIR